MDSIALSNGNVNSKFSLSEDKGVSFDFADNERLKASGFALEGKSVGGVLTKDGVMVNINSPRALNSIVGHEITHVLEGTEHYDALKSAVLEYARAKGEYQSRYDALVGLYAGMDADIEAELAADLVGDYIFTDAEFVSRLSAEQPKLFQKLWNEIKHFCKWATAGSKEARRLEKAKKLFDDAYRENKSPTLPEGEGVKYSVSGEDTKADDGVSLDNIAITAANVENLRSIGRKSVNAFTSEEIQKTEPWARKFYSELGAKSPFFRAWFGDWRASDQSKVDIVVANPDSSLKSGKIKNVDTQKVISWSAHDIHGESLNHAVKDKAALEALNQIDEIAQKAILFDTVVSMPTSKSKMPHTAFMHSFYTIYENNDGRYLLKLYVEEALSNKGDKVFTRAYELKDIEKVADIQSGIHSQGRGLTTDTSATKYSIAELHNLVKTYDKEFSPKVVSPLLLNEDGTPKVFYHGGTADFTVFDKDMIGSASGVLYGEGFYFTPDREVAEEYAEVSSGYYSTKLYECYLSIKKPYFLKERDYYSYDTEKVKEQGYDGALVINGREILDAVVFEPEQIKSATDNIGTFDGKNPDIRYSLSEENASNASTPDAWNIKGEDVALAPIGENVVRTSTDEVKKEVTAPIGENVKRVSAEKKESGITAPIGENANYDLSPNSEITKSFHIENVNDSVNVQKNVFATLVSEKFFDEDKKRVVSNDNSGMIVEINKSGIDETFSYKNFGKRGNHVCWCIRL